MTTVLQKRGTRWYARVRWYHNGNTLSCQYLNTYSEGVNWVDMMQVSMLSLEG